MSQRSLFTIERARGVGSLERLMFNIGSNFGDKQLSKVIRAGWISTKEEQIEAARSILPMRQKPYEPSHYANIFRPRRKPGTFRKSAKFRATPVKKGQVPRSYLWVAGWPWPFLVHGTDERKRRDGRSTGSVPDRIPEEIFFDDLGPRIFGQAIDRISRAPNFTRPFDRR